MHWVWNAVSKLLIGCANWAVCSEGLRLTVPSLSQKLYRVFPLLGFLKRDEWGHRLDLASLWAIILTFLVWLLIWIVMRLWLTSDETYGDNRDKCLSAAATLATIIVGFDLYVFCRGTSELSFDGGIGFESLFSTVAYLAIIVTCIFVGEFLKSRN